MADLPSNQSTLITAGTGMTITFTETEGDYWDISFASSGGGVTDADFLVGTAHAGLSAEIVVGATPGGELGGTWALPTVDATHSGSTHAAATTTHEAAADPHTGYRLESADHTHATTGLQGGTIAHSATTGQTATDHHSNANDHAQGHAHSAAGDGTTLSPATLNLPATATPAQTADGQVVWDSDGDFLTVGDGVSRQTFLPVVDATSNPLAVGTAADGTEATVARKDHVHATGAGTPSTQAFGDAAAVGTGPAASMTDHKHAMMADPTTAHVAAGDPHTGYVLETWEIMARKASDQTWTSDAVVDDVTTLGFAIGANDVWVFDLLLWVAGATTGDIQLGFTGPAGVTIKWGAAVGAATASTNTTASSVSWGQETTGTRNFATVGVATFGLLRIAGIARNGATGGTIQLQAAQGVSDATATTIQADSVIIAKRIA